jgi:hypothetical protein
LSGCHSGACPGRDPGFAGIQKAWIRDYPGEAIENLETKIETGIDRKR